MSIKYYEIPKSKYTTLQFEIPINCQLRDIQALLSTNVCNDTPQIQNPVQASYCAFLVENITGTLSNIKNVRDSTTTIQYGIFNNKFIISISFESNAKYQKLALNICLSIFYQTNLNVAYNTLKSQKTFLASNTRDQIMNSVHLIPLTLKLTIFSKMNEDKFKTSIIDKYLRALLNKFRDSISRVSVDPIVNQKYIISEDYNKFEGSLGQLGSVVLSLVLVTLNDYNVNYIFIKDSLYIQKQQMKPNIVQQCIELIKSRLAVNTIKEYDSLSIAVKNKTDKTKYNDSKRQKQIIANKQLVQMVASSAVFPENELNSLFQEIPDERISRIKFDELKFYLGRTH